MVFFSWLSAMSGDFQGAKLPKRPICEKKPENDGKSLLSLEKSDKIKSVK